MKLTIQRMPYSWIIWIIKLGNYIKTYARITCVWIINSVTLFQVISEVIKRVTVIVL